MDKRITRSLLVLVMAAGAVTASAQSPPPELAQSNRLAGTWQGELSNGEEAFAAEFHFDESDHWLMRVENSAGVSTYVAVTAEGQEYQFVPPGGGVKTMRVRGLERQGKRLLVVLETSFERSSNGYLDQQYFQELLVFELTAASLETRLESRSTSYIGDSGGSMGGGGDIRVATGLLQRAR